MKKFLALFVFFLIPFLSFADFGNDSFSVGGKNQFWCRVGITLSFCNTGDILELNGKIKAGTSVAGTAPIKLTAGTNLTVPETGAIEFDGTNLFFTDSTPTRQTIFTGAGGIANVVDDTTPTLGGNLDGGGFNISNVIDSTTKRLFFSPKATQSITATTNTIVNTAGYLAITPDADYVLTSTPNITLGTDGQILIIHNDSAFTVTLQDESVLASSGISVDGASGLIKAGGIITLFFDNSNSVWRILSNPNTAAAGANASLLQVRNTSGTAISAGKAVYITGYNVGQGRLTIGLADADDPTKIPAIGITETSISNNTNGEVISSGDAIGLINTSSATVNDGVWLGTTAGEVVFTRPTIDDVQRLGTVSRSNASGNVMITGAGRINDNPNVISATTLNISGNITGSMLLEDGTFSLPSLAFTNDTDTGLFSANTNTELGISVGGVERIRIDSSGNVGIGTSVPLTALDIKGGTAKSVVVKVATYTATISDYTIICDTNTAGAGFTINLPTASSSFNSTDSTGLILNIKNTGTGAFNITLDGNASETIDGATTQTIGDDTNLTIQSDGTNWIIL